MAIVSAILYYIRYVSACGQSASISVPDVYSDALGGRIFRQAGARVLLAKASLPAVSSFGSEHDST